MKAEYFYFDISHLLNNESFVRALKFSSLKYFYAFLHATCNTLLVEGIAIEKNEIGVTINAYIGLLLCSTYFYNI